MNIFWRRKYWAGQAEDLLHSRLMGVRKAPNMGVSCGIEECRNSIDKRGIRAQSGRMNAGEAGRMRVTQGT